MGLFTRSNDDDRAQKLTYSERHNTGGLVASAARINLSRKSEVESMKARQLDDKWQNDAWDYYDLVPEIKYAANLIANVTSRVRLYAGWITDEDSAPSNIQDIDEASDELKSRAREALHLLASGNGGIPGVLRDAALNLFVAGECYLVREPAQPGDSFGIDTWQIRSVREIVVSSEGGVSIKGRRSTKPANLVKLPRTAYFGRIWRTHPAYSDEADSSMRGLLELCDQMLLYSRAARGITKSRLNAGMLFLPDELSNISQSDGEMEAGDPLIMAPLSDDDSDAFEEELIDAMTTPISDEASASAVVPLIVRGPAELGEKIRHLTFDRPFDPQIALDAERTLERILSGLDIPKDIVAGMASVKYSNAITIEESLYKAHIEPMVLMIIDSLTVVLLHPILRSLGFTEDEINRTVVWYDPSAITTKPDKATAATTGYEMQVISGQAWRRANGFSESDKPTDLEVAQRMAVDKGLISEPVMEALLYTLIPDLLNRVREEQRNQMDPDARKAVDRAVAGDTVPETPESGKNDDDNPTPPVELIEP